MANNTKDKEVAFKATSDGKAIGAMTAWLKTTNKVFMERAHIAAVSCILHVVYYKTDEGQHTGTTQMANNLCDVLSGDKRGNSLRKWFEVVGPMRWDNTTKTLKLHKGKVEKMRAVDEKELTESLLKGITFWALDPPKPYKAIDFWGDLESFIDKAEKRLDAIEAGDVEEEDASKNKVTREDIAIARKFLAKRAA